METNQPLKNFLLTGPKKIGKSTILSRVFEFFPTVSIGGVVTEPVENNGGITTGYQIRDYNNQQLKKIFAHIDWKKATRMAQFGVNPEVFNTYGKSWIEMALFNYQIIVIDELGFMESQAFEFQQAVFECLDSSQIVCGVIKQKANPFLQKITDRSDVLISQVTTENRASLVDYLVKQIQVVL